MHRVPTDAPLEGDALIGRADDVDAIARALVGGGNVFDALLRRYLAELPGAR